MEETIFSLGDPSLEDSNSGQNTDNETSPNTKVYYYMDDSTTPYVSIIPASSDSLTLGDFRNIFTNKGYKYFCKELDKDIGCEVKIELTDDHCRLKRSANGLFELFLLTIPGGGTLPRHSGTLPRKAPKPNNIYMGVGFTAEKTTSRRRRSLECLDDGSFVPSTITASSRGTVVSRRAGEHLAEVYTSNSEDPYRFEETNSAISLTESSLYDTVAVRPGDARSRRRKPRKERYRKAYVPSTISSVTESSMTSLSLPQILEVHISLHSPKYLGISVLSWDGSILVSNIMPDGEVAKDGRIEVGDQIIQVNHTSFEKLNDKQAVQLLRDVAAAKKPLVFFIAKRPHPHLLEHQSETLSTLAADATMPLDISMWVQTAVQYRNYGELEDRSEMTFEDGTLGTNGLTTDDEEEEQRLYMERRNGVPVPRTALEEAERRRENERNEQIRPGMLQGQPGTSELPTRLSCRMDPSVVVRAMARANSGLQLKNRKWLKILVPMSFIGRELVEWLLEHIEDIPDRKAAKLYAAQLLNLKLIRHFVHKLTFTEKCYYVFEESIIGRGGADSSQNSGGTMKLEANTEVTYLGSPLPPGHARGRMPTQTGPFPRADETWPISPITVLETTRRNARRRDCESPVTNEYASMVGVESSVNTRQSNFMRQAPPPTPLCGSTMLNPPHPSPCETEFEDDDRRKIVRPEKGGV